MTTLVESMDDKDDDDDVDDDADADDDGCMTHV